MKPFSVQPPSASTPGEVRRAEICAAGAGAMNRNPFPPRAPLHREEIIAAITSLIVRMDAIDAQCEAKFPLYSRGTENCWTVSTGGSGVGGFWAASWWRRAQITGLLSDRCNAALICRRLAPKVHAASINRSMLFWYGAALGAMAFDDPEAHALAQDAADALAASFDPTLRCIPVGIDMEGGHDGDRRIGVGTLAPLIHLLHFNHDNRHCDIAQRHADTVITACLTEAGACHAGAVAEHDVFRPIGHAGAWSRGQAWAMLGLSTAAVQWGGRYISLAQSACKYWRQTRSQAEPPNRSDLPSALKDPSSSLIAALAMLSLATVSADGKRWSNEAQRRIAALLRGRHFVRQKNGAAIFWGACYQVKPGIYELVESAWSNFLLLEALCLLADIGRPATGISPSHACSFSRSKEEAP